MGGLTTYSQSERLLGFLGDIIRGIFFASRKNRCFLVGIKEVEDGRSQNVHW